MNEVFFWCVIAVDAAALVGFWWRWKRAQSAGVQPSEPWPKPGEIGRNPSPNTPRPPSPPAQAIEDSVCMEKWYGLTEWRKGQFAMFFGMLQEDVWHTADTHGWHERELNDGEAIALMHSELSEALEALRHGDPPDDHIPDFTGAEAELADVVIRIMGYAQRKGFRVAEAIIAKAEYNKTRPHKHGNKKF